MAVISGEQPRRSKEPSTGDCPAGPGHGWEPGPTDYESELVDYWFPNRSLSPPVLNAPVSDWQLLGVASEEPLKPAHMTRNSSGVIFQLCFLTGPNNLHSS